MIGIFDSGLGGLTVVKSITEVLPKVSLTYLGDTARLPYGNRSEQAVYEFTQQGVDFLFQKGCQMVIVACNTASAKALRTLQQEWLPKQYPDRKILGVIRPLAERAAEITKTNAVGVIGTRGTILSKAYIRELQAQKKDIKVFQQACPLLVPLIEERMHKRPEAKKIIRSYLRVLKQKNIDTLILGCTHYPIAQKTIQDIMGKRCSVLDSAKIISQSLKDYLDRHPEIDKKLDTSGTLKFYVTDITDNFQNMANSWMGKPVPLEKIEL